MALAQVQMPLMVLPLIAALVADRSEPARRRGGCWAPARGARSATVTLPLSLPGIVAGCLLTFTAAVTAFITQSLIGGGQMLFMPCYI